MLRGRGLQHPAAGGLHVLLLIGGLVVEQRQQLDAEQAGGEGGGPQAQAEQDAAKIKAETKLIEAEAEKKANELLNQSLTDMVLQMEWIEKWNGQMPTYYSGSDDGMSVILNPESVN